jgi:hypothetical protein
MKASATSDSYGGQQTLAVSDASTVGPNPNVGVPATVQPDGHIAGE